MTQVQAVGQAVKRFIKQKSIYRTTRIQVGLAGFLMGLWVAGQALTIEATMLVLGLAVVPLLVSRTLLGLVAALVFGLSVGYLRGEAVIVQTGAYEVYFDQEVNLGGRVADDSTYNRFGQREFTLQEVHINGQPAPGRVEVSGFGITTIQRGDTVAATGKLKPGYGSDNAQVSFAEVEIVRRLDSPVAQVRKSFFAGTYSAIGEPEASLGLGFLVGGRTLLPDELLAALSITGLTHIVAVSGYNLTILVRLMRRSLARISKYWATAGSFALIVSFISITGISPSIARASVVTALALTAWYFGRRLSPTMLLLVSGAVTAGITPNYIWSDLGWWLSFLAFIGVLIIAPLLTKRLYKDKRPGTIMQIVIETSCAQLMAMPLIGAIFGEFSLIAVLANVVVLPLIPLAMLLTFVAGLAGWWLAPWAGWLAWPARMLLELITSLVTILSNVPRALLAVELTTLEMVAIYGVIFAAVGVLALKLKQQNFQLDGAEVIK